MRRNTFSKAALKKYALTLTALLSITQGLTVRRKTEDFPLMDCHTADIDLLFVVDGGTSAASTVGIENYRKQMLFFSQLVDVFVPPAEKTLSRVRIAVIASMAEGTAPFYKPQMRSRASFNSYTSKTEFKKFLENDVISPVPISFPISAALYAMQDVFNESTLGARAEAQRVLILMVNGAKPLQINPSDDMRAFNSTSVKLLVVLVGSESGVHIMSIFPSNNLVQVTSFSDLMQNQMVPIMLCLKCYDNWFRFKASEDEDIIANISCYRVFYSFFDLNWVQAGESCLAVESDLVSIETKEELSFLRETLPSKIHEIMNRTGDSNDSVDIIIGLKRDISSYGQRFIWINSLPLGYTAWEGGEPLGGHIQGCALWNFNVTVYSDYVLPETIVNAWSDIRNRTEYQNVNDGWYSIGCGYKNARYYLCESKKPPSFRESHMPNITKANDKSIKAAVARGELALLTKVSETFGTIVTLVSIASVIQTAQKVSSVSVIDNHVYNNRFPVENLILFSCEDASRTRIPYSLVCDFVAHCENKRDEQICNYRKCDSLTEFTCSNGQCISLEAQCDLFSDCVDESDEGKCIKCRNGLCHDGRCLPKHWFADGEVDCNACTSRGNVKAEMASVPDDNIAECAFTCNRTQCTYTFMLGDGIVDCAGPEGPLDETIGTFETSKCYAQEDNVTNIYNNWAPRCVYIKDRYEGLLGCRNLVHLQNCDNFVCPEGYIKCVKSYCIPIHYVANGVYDCPLGEDESGPLNCAGNFQCSSSDICLHPDNVCDGHPHCPKGDDELNCGISCKPGFQCITGVVTVKGYDVSVPLNDLSFIDPRTRYLDLSGVNISSAFPEFPKGRLYNVLEMYMANCGITHLDAVSYSQNDLWSVVRADFSYNQVTNIGVTSIFRYMVNLKVLNLSHNTDLSFLHPDSFNTYGFVSQLIVLDLSFTAISSLHYTLLSPLLNLQELSLKATQLTEMTSDMFPEEYKLQVLDLRQLEVKTLTAHIFSSVTVYSHLYTDTFKLCCPQLHNGKTPSYVCDAPPDPFSSCSDLMGESILRVLLWVFGCLAIIGNIVVIFYRMMYERNILKMAYGHFVMHLSVSDMCMGVYLLIVAGADTYYRGTYVWDEMDWRNSNVCKIAGFLSTLSSEVSTFYIFLITVDRFLIIRFPFGQIKMSGRLITFCCGFAWCMGFVLALIPLLPPFEEWTIYRSNGVCLGLPLINTRQPGWQFSTTVFIFLNLFLFIIIAIGQLIIYKTMANMRMGHSAITNTNYRRLQDFEVAKHLSLIAISNFCCWFPIGVMGLLALDGYHLGIETYAWTAVLIMPMNSALNPFIYTIPALMQRWSEFMFKISRDDSSRANTRTND
ncbi:G-protein coupled receptor GRL101 [Biomphalaria glabrata]|nr:G-protein coupled receptor [Biomphalaria glabrata]